MYKHELSTAIGNFCLSTLHSAAFWAGAFDHQAAPGAADTLKKSSSLETFQGFQGSFYSSSKASQEERLLHYGQAELKYNCHSSVSAEAEGKQSRVLKHMSILACYMHAGHASAMVVSRLIPAAVVASAPQENQWLQVTGTTPKPCWTENISNITHHSTQHHSLALTYPPAC